MSIGFTKEKSTMASADKLDVIETVNSYTIIMNSRQWDLFDDILLPDAVIEFGGSSAWNDLAKFKANFAEYHAQYDSSQHIAANHLVRIDGDDAWCLCYVHGHFLRAAAVGGNLYETTGWYDCRLVRTESGWKIAHLRFRMVRWSGNANVMLLTPGGKAYDPDLNKLHADVEAGEVAFFQQWFRC